MRNNKPPHPLTYTMFQKTLRKLLCDIGENEQNYSSHSFRRGGASWAFQSGVASELIQLTGDWQSDANKVYLKFSLKDKIQVCQKMQQQIIDYNGVFQVDESISPRS
jgi:hypothetical protein